VVSVSAEWEDLHSGYYGGAVREPFADLVALLASLKAACNGSSIVPGPRTHARTHAHSHISKEARIRWVGYGAGLEAAALTAEEKGRLKRITFRDNDLNLPPGWEASPLPAFQRGGERQGDDRCQEDQELMALGQTWWRPCLTVHGIQGGWTQPGCRTVSFVRSTPIVLSFGEGERESLVRGGVNGGREEISEPSAYAVL
jgi:hypothetical protein